MFTGGRYPEGHEIAARCGLDIAAVGLALDALDGEYLDVQRTGSFEHWGVFRVTPAARRAAGQWPTAENLIDRLIAGLEQAAERETDPAQKNRLHAVARELGTGAKAVAYSVAAQILGHAITH
jgi:hypothetical protein